MKKVTAKELRSAHNSLSWSLGDWKGRCPGDDLNAALGRIEAAQAALGELLERPMRVTIQPEEFRAARELLLQAQEILAGGSRVIADTTAALRMSNISNDPEVGHEDAEEILIGLLQEQGFNRTVKVFREKRGGFWYA